jgi:hypothetical protein
MREELRREKVGAPDWLHRGSDDGARWNATVVPPIASCQRHDIEPRVYLRDVLTLLPSWPAKGVLALAPKSWSETSQEPDSAGGLRRRRAGGARGAALVLPVGVKIWAVSAPAICLEKGWPRVWKLVTSESPANARQENPPVTWG